LRQTTAPNWQNPFNIMTKGLPKHRIGLSAPEHKAIVNAVSRYFSCPFTPVCQVTRHSQIRKLRKFIIDRPSTGRPEETSSSLLIKDGGAVL